MPLPWGYILSQHALHLNSWPSCALHLKTWPILLFTTRCHSLGGKLELYTSSENMNSLQNLLLLHRGLFYKRPTSLKMHLYKSKKRTCPVNIFITEVSAFPNKKMIYDAQYNRKFVGRDIQRKLDSPVEMIMVSEKRFYTWFHWNSSHQHLNIRIYYSIRNAMHEKLTKMAKDDIWTAHPMCIALDKFLSHRLDTCMSLITQGGLQTRKYTTTFNFGLLPTNSIVILNSTCSLW